MFVALSLATLLLAGIAFRVVASTFLTIKPGLLSPGVVIVSEIFSLIALIFTMFVISRIEKRTIGSYGLPLRCAFRSSFWSGAVFGFLFLTLLLLAIRGLHGFYFGSIGLRGGLLLRYAALWAIAFLLVGVWEEYFFRGYLQFVLTRGLGFWPAAAATALLFGAVHGANQGESWLGLAAVVWVGLFFCLTLRRTGDLWFAVGFHASWDYTQSFLYGVPDSGQPAIGHLLNSQLQQNPAWLTGGTVGPEGSVLVFADIVLAALVVAWLYPKAKYPESAVSTPDPVAAENHA